MSSYDARLGLPHQPGLPLPIRVETSGSSITLTLGESLIASWALDQISITRDTRGFRILAEDEDLLINIIDAERFALEMGIDLASDLPTRDADGVGRLTSQPFA